MILGPRGGLEVELEAGGHLAVALTYMTGKAKQKPQI